MIEPQTKHQLVPCLGAAEGAELVDGGGVVLWTPETLGFVRRIQGRNGAVGPR